MRAGRGTIHEEMWNIKPNKLIQKIEIYQLWVNLPSHSKLAPPKVTHLYNDNIPIYTTKGCSVKVISGTLSIHSDKLGTDGNESSSSISSISSSCLSGSSISSSSSSGEHSDTIGTEEYIGPGTAESSSPIHISHIQLDSNEGIILTLPTISTVAVYIRRGSVITSSTEDCKEISSCSFLTYNVKESHNSDLSELFIQSGSRGCDLLLLVGEPLYEPVSCLLHTPVYLNTCMILVYYGTTSYYRWSCAVRWYKRQ